MRNKLTTEMFNPNTFLKKIYKNDDESKIENNEKYYMKIRMLINLMIKIVFVLAIFYFLFNLIFSKQNTKYKRTFKSRRK